jgi:hypothetical protein
MHYLFTGDTIQLRGRERHELVDGATGQPIAQPNAPTDLLRLLAVARRDPNIRRALRFFLSPTAQNLHKVYEIIRDDAGGEAPDVVNKGWATALDIDRFRSVHYPSVLSEEARHGVEPKRRAAPVDPMSLVEARAFVASLLKCWLTSK